MGECPHPRQTALCRVYVNPRMDIKSEFKTIIKKDKQLSDLVRLGSLPPALREASSIVAHSGDAKFWWPVLILLWIFGSIFWKQWTVTVTIGIALAGAAQWVIKRLVSRDRPIGVWGRKTRDKDPRSFPSGHATRTFLLAVLTTGLGPAWLAVLFWTWAVLVSLSRVVMGVHYLSDVIGGLLLAIIVGVIWLSVHEGALQLLLTFFLRVLHLPLW
jgi:undecaprenyl-diphosphatase